MLSDYVSHRSGARAREGAPTRRKGPISTRCIDLSPPMTEACVGPSGAREGRLTSGSWKTVPPKMGRCAGCAMPSRPAVDGRSNSASFTKGTSTTNMSDVFAGNWTRRSSGRVSVSPSRPLTERYAELGQNGIIAHWRGDVALTRPRAFSAYRYLKSN